MPPSTIQRLRPATIAIAVLAGSAILASRTMSSTSSKPADTTTSSPFPVKAYTPRHSTWPYKASDFARQDESSDTNFYGAPRFVTHIDDHAISQLRRYYSTVLPRKGRILDFCSSWVSHYPKEVEEAASKGDVKVTGMGMNKAELEANKVLDGGGRICWDLNSDATVGKALDAVSGMKDEKVDASTCVVSIDYLTSPREVLEALRSRTVSGGSVHLAISNRCFPTKAVGRWLKVDEEERLNMVGDYLHFAGWTKIEIVDLSGKDEEDEAGAGPAPKQQGLAGLMNWMGMGGHDPLWVVRGVNPPGGGDVGEGEQKETRI